MKKNQKDRVFVEKVWGSEDWIENSPLYCGKKMTLKKGYQCSTHSHLVKAETFYVSSGRMLLRYGYGETMEEVIMEPGDSFFIPVGMRHQFQGLEDTEFFEFSTQHFDDDCVRFSASGKVGE